MRSLLLQLLSVLCFYGILFTTGKRPNYFVPNSKPAKELAEISKPKNLPIKKVESTAQSVKPKPSSSFTLFPKAPNHLMMAAASQPAQKVKQVEAVRPKTAAVVNTPGNTLQFQIAAETSLREYPGQEAEVLKRIGEGERVEIIERSEKYWWKVNYAGRIGWVKRHLLVQA